VSFVFAETPGMQMAAAANAGLAGETSGAAGTTTGAGAVVPPGLEEVSAVNVAKIQAYVAEATALLSAAAAFQGLYSASVTTAAVAYTVTDSAGAAGI
jgi:hypothetical protein